MQNIIEFIKESRQNRQKRKTVILVGMAIILVLIYLVMLVSCSEKKLPPEGSERVLICPNCHERVVLIVKDIHVENHLCPKCSSRLEKCLKCGDCGFEFPYSDKELAVSANTDKAQKFTRLNELRRCPQCGSVNTHVLSPSVLESRNDRKKRYRVE